MDSLFRTKRLVAEHHNIIVIGAGQGGLGVSYYLTKAGVEHLVLERSDIASSWKDLLYRQRLEKTPITFNSLDEIVHEDFADLEVAHRSNDSWYSELCSSLTEEKLASDFSFKAVGLDVEEYYALPLKTCLSNLFQHQIHHRGQVHHMISHANYDPPPLDFVKFGSNDSDKWTHYLGQND